MAVREAGAASPRGMRKLRPYPSATSFTSPAFPGEPAKQPAPPDQAVTDIAEKAHQSLAVILYTGRDGKQIGLGTGFVVGDGLIATNLHVIGEGRPISVRLPGGKVYEATEVFASDRRLDLAIVRIAVKGLKSLPLGDDKALKL